MQITQVTPIFRIFDYAKAIEFYVDWLGFKIDWEHRFEDHSPIYMQVSKDGMTLHLSEHHGDATPGARTYVICTDLKTYHEELSRKNYKYNRPGYEKTFYGTYAVQVTDPFGNHITFNEPIEQKED